MENKPHPLLNHFPEKAQSQKAVFKATYKRLRKTKPKALDQLFSEAHERAFKEIDCLDCGRCCKTTGPLITQSDINRLAKHIKLKPAQFIDQYLRVDEDGDFVLQQVPCPFLGADNFCSVYEKRPRACADYPHTHRPGMKQRLNITAKNAEICPAVFHMTQNILDRLP